MKFIHHKPTYNIDYNNFPTGYKISPSIYDFRDLNVTYYVQKYTQKCTAFSSENLLDKMET